MPYNNDGFYVESTLEPSGDGSIITRWKIHIAQPLYYYGSSTADIDTAILKDISHFEVEYGYVLKTEGEEAGELDNPITKMTIPQLDSSKLPNSYAEWQSGTGSFEVVSDPIISVGSPSFADRNEATLSYRKMYYFRHCTVGKTGVRSDWNYFPNWTPGTSRVGRGIYPDPINNLRGGVERLPVEPPASATDSSFNNTIMLYWDAPTIDNTYRNRDFKEYYIIRYDNGSESPACVYRTHSNYFLDAYNIIDAIGYKYEIYSVSNDNIFSGTCLTKYTTGSGAPPTGGVSADTSLQYNTISAVDSAITGIWNGGITDYDYTSIYPENRASNSRVGLPHKFWGYGYFNSLNTKGLKIVYADGANRATEPDAFLLAYATYDNDTYSVWVQPTGGSLVFMGTGSMGAGTALYRVESLRFVTAEIETINETSGFFASPLGEGLVSDKAYPVSVATQDPEDFNYYSLGSYIGKDLIRYEYIRGMTGAFKSVTAMYGSIQYLSTSSMASVFFEAGKFYTRYQSDEGPPAVYTTNAIFEGYESTNNTISNPRFYPAEHNQGTIGIFTDINSGDRWWNIGAIATIQTTEQSFYIYDGVTRTRALDIRGGTETGEIVIRPTQYYPNIISFVGTSDSAFTYGNIQEIYCSKFVMEQKGTYNDPSNIQGWMPHLRIYNAGYPITTEGVTKAIFRYDGADGASLYPVGDDTGAIGDYIAGEGYYWWKYIRGFSHVAAQFQLVDVDDRSITILDIKKLGAAPGGGSYYGIIPYSTNSAFITLGTTDNKLDQIWVNQLNATSIEFDNTITHAISIVDNTSEQNIKMILDVTEAGQPRIYPFDSNGSVQSSLGDPGNTGYDYVWTDAYVRNIHTSHIYMQNQNDYRTGASIGEIKSEVGEGLSFIITPTFAPSAYNRSILGWRESGFYWSEVNTVDFYSTGFAVMNNLTVSTLSLDAVTVNKSTGYVETPLLMIDGTRGGEEIISATLRGGSEYGPIFSTNNSQGPFGSIGDDGVSWWNNGYIYLMNAHNLFFHSGYNWSSPSAWITFDNNDELSFSPGNASYGYNYAGQLGTDANYWRVIRSRDIYTNRVYVKNENSDYAVFGMNEAGTSVQLYPVSESIDFDIGGPINQINNIYARNIYTTGDFTLAGNIVPQLNNTFEVGSTGVGGKWWEKGGFYSVNTKRINFLTGSIDTDSKMVIELSDDDWYQMYITPDAVNKSRIGTEWWPWGYIYTNFIGSVDRPVVNLQVDSINGQPFINPNYFSQMFLIDSNAPLVPTVYMFGKVSPDNEPQIYPSGGADGFGNLGIPSNWWKKIYASYIRTKEMLFTDGNGETFLGITNGTGLSHWPYQQIVPWEDLTVEVGDRDYWFKAGRFESVDTSQINFVSPTGSRTFAQMVINQSQDGYWQFYPEASVNSRLGAGGYFWDQAYLANVYSNIMYLHLVDNVTKTIVLDGAYTITGAEHKGAIYPYATNMGEIGISSKWWHQGRFVNFDTQRWNLVNPSNPDHAVMYAEYNSSSNTFYIYPNRSYGQAYLGSEAVTSAWWTNVSSDSMYSRNIWIRDSSSNNKVRITSDWVDIDTSKGGIIPGLDFSNDPNTNPSHAPGVAIGSNYNWFGSVRANHFDVSSIYFYPNTQTPGGRQDCSVLLSSRYSLPDQNGNPQTRDVTLFYGTWGGCLMLGFPAGTLDGNNDSRLYAVTTQNLYVRQIGNPQRVYRDRSGQPSSSTEGVTDIYTTFVFHEYCDIMGYNHPSIGVGQSSCFEQAWLRHIYCDAISTNNIYAVYYNSEVWRNWDTYDDIALIRQMKPIESDPYTLDIDSVPDILRSQYASPSEGFTESIESKRGINLNSIIALNTGAIKQMSYQVDELKERIAVLEAQLAAK